MMVISFKVDFSSINADGLKIFNHQHLFDTEPWSYLDLSVLKGLNLDIDLRTRAKNKFFELSQSTISSFDVLDVLALITVEQVEQQDKVILDKVCDNWWGSLVNDESKRNSLFTSLIFCLHYHQANSFKNIMIEGLIRNLLGGGNHNWRDKNLEFIVVCILTNSTDNLAEFALREKISIKNLFEFYPLIASAKFKERTEIYWFEKYLNLSENQLKDYSRMINLWLNEKGENNLVFAMERAKNIFDNPYFYQDLKKLETQTHKFGDIYKWLKKWSSHQGFKTGLTAHYLQILRCWIGAGNYYQLEKTVRAISMIHGEHLVEKGRNISLNRYFFWTNYQQYIMDYWLLIPENSGYKYEQIAKDENIKPLIGYGFGVLNPFILLRFEDCCFIQPLVYRAPECELVMTKAMTVIDGIIAKDKVNIQELLNIEPCLIHDFYFGWQQEMYCYLKLFNINATSNTIKVAESPNGSDFCIDGLSGLSVKDGADRTKQLTTWCRNAERNPLRHAKNKLMTYAKNLKTNRVI